MGGNVHAVTEFLTPNELCAMYKKVRGEKLRYQEVSFDEFQALLPPLLADLPHQMAMVREFWAVRQGRNRSSTRA